MDPVPSVGPLSLEASDAPEASACSSTAGLVERAREGDEDAFAALCREHGDRLLRQALGLCGDAAAAEDLVQETLLAAWRSLARYHGGCRFFTWLCSILIHRHRSVRRRRRPIPFSFLFGEVDDAEPESMQDRLADGGSGPGATVERAERAAIVLRSLNRLPDRQRDVVYLRFYAGDSLEGIAAALGCSVGTVKSRLFHGLERLRRMKVLAEQKDL